MVVNNLYLLEKLLSGASKAKKRKDSSGKFRTVPLFKVSASLSAPEIIISPMANEIHKMLFKLIRSIIESTKLFHRWMNGTCIFTPPQKIPDEEEPLLFTFYTDMLSNPAVLSIMSSLNACITKTFSEMNKWIELWRKYRPLWKVDKVLT